MTGIHFTDEMIAVIIGLGCVFAGWSLRLLWNHDKELSWIKRDVDRLVKYLIPENASQGAKYPHTRRATDHQGD